MKAADPLFSPETVRSLFSWFRREGIAYPWGEEITPYRVWVSEVMLQQTVITTVIPYFRRWMERFPRLEDLAAAQEAEVLRLWEGLGYYSRARNLLAAARLTAQHYGGKLPDEPTVLKTLPGIGEYTARAVLSISRGLPLAVMDANVRRIGRRVAGLTEWDAQREGELLERLEAALPGENPGEFNAALMQLGQLVCRIRSPRCSVCPLASGCRAFREDLTGVIPGVKKREIIPRETELFIYLCRGRVFLHRKIRGVGKGLWVFPGREFRAGGSAGGAGAGQAAAEQEPPFSPGVRPGRELQVRIHNYTRYRDTLRPRLWLLQEPRVPDGWPAGEENASGGEAGWFSRKEFAALAVPSVYRKILKELEAIPELADPEA